MKINSITNSHHNNRQNQQAFGIFRCTHPMEEVAPVVRRAEQLGIKLFAPNDVDSHVYGKCLYTSKIFNDIGSHHTFRRSLEGYIYTGAEQDGLVKTAQTSDLTHLVRTVFNMQKNPKPFDFGAFRRSVDAIEETENRIRMNKAKIEEAKLQMQAADRSNDAYTVENHRQWCILRNAGIIE